MEFLEAGLCFLSPTTLGYIYSAFKAFRTSSWPSKQSRIQQICSGEKKKKNSEFESSQCSNLSHQTPKPTALLISIFHSGGSLCLGNSKVCLWSCSESAKSPSRNKENNQRSSAQLRKLPPLWDFSCSNNAYLAVLTPLKIGFKKNYPAFLVVTVGMLVCHSIPPKWKTQLSLKPSFSLLLLCAFS